MSTILITGTSSGLGKELASQLYAAGHTVIGFDLEDGSVTNYSSCVNFAQHCQEKYGDVDILINNAGVNIINFLNEFDSEEWDAVMDTNAKGIFNMTKAFLPLLHDSSGTVVNIVSNASHMPMTASLAYNASKGAAHIMTLQLARELKPRYNIDVFGVSPNKLSGTGMSASIDEQCVAVRGWTPEYAREYQLKSLPAGEETDPKILAEFLTFLLQDKQHHKYLTGCVIPYGG